MDGQRAGQTRDAPRVAFANRTNRGGDDPFDMEVAS